MGDDEEARVRGRVGEGKHIRSESGERGRGRRRLSGCQTTGDVVY